MILLKFFVFLVLHFLSGFYLSNLLEKNDISFSTRAGLALILSYFTVFIINLVSWIFVDQFYPFYTLGILLLISFCGLAQLISRKQWRCFLPRLPSSLERVSFLIIGAQLIYYIVSCLWLPSFNVDDYNHFSGTSKYLASNGLDEYFFKNGLNLFKGNTIASRSYPMFLPFNQMFFDFLSGGHREIWTKLYTFPIFLSSILICWGELQKILNRQIAVFFSACLSLFPFLVRYSFDPVGEPPVAIYSGILFLLFVRSNESRGLYRWMIPILLGTLAGVKLESAYSAVIGLGIFTLLQRREGRMPFKIVGASFILLIVVIGLWKLILQKHGFHFSRWDSALAPNQLFAALFSQDSLSFLMRGLKNFIFPGKRVLFLGTLAFIAFLMNLRRPKSQLFWLSLWPVLAMGMYYGGAVFTRWPTEISRLFEHTYLVWVFLGFVTVGKELIAFNNQKLQIK